MTQPIPDAGPTLAAVRMAGAMGDARQSALYRDFRKLYEERVNKPRENLHGLLDDAAVSGAIAMEDVTDAMVQLASVVVDDKSANRINAIDESDPRAVAMGEIEILLLVRGLLNGMMATKLARANLSMVDMGEIMARYNSVTFKADRG